MTGVIHRNLLPLVFLILAGQGLCALAQHQPPALEAGSEVEFVERKLSQLEAAETEVQRAAIVRMAFPAVDLVAFRGEMAKAEELYARILEAAEVALVDDREAIGELMAHATRVDMWREEFGSAADGIRFGLELVGDDNVYRGILLNALAICVDYSDGPEAALPHAEAALLATQPHASEWAEVHGLVLNTLAVLLSEIGQVDKAAKTRDQLQAHMEAHPGTHDSMRLTQFMGMATLAYKAGLENESRAYFLSAIAECEERYSSDPGSLESSLFIYGVALTDWGAFEEAIDVLERASEMFESRWQNESVPYFGLHSKSPWRGLARAYLGADRHVDAFEALNRYTGRITLPARGRHPEVGANDAWSPSSIQSVLKADEAFVAWVFQYQLGVDWAAAVVLRNEGPPQWYQLDLPRGYRFELFRSYRQSLSLKDADSLTIPDPASAVASANELYSAFFAPLEDALEGVNQVLALGSQSLNVVPLTALVDDAGRYLGERFRFTMVPSSAFVFGMRASASVEAQRFGDRWNKVVLLGDPPFQAQHVRAMGTQGEGLLTAWRETRGLRRGLRGLAPGELPRLIGTREEVLELASLFPSAELLLGTDAKLEAIRDRAQVADVLHLATHAEFKQGNYYESALFFACAEDGAPSSLTVEEILAKWRLKAELVTLSACSTGLSQETEGGAELGFPQVFLAAGAHSVLGSLWAVDDVATTLFMTSFYRAWIGAEGAEPVSKAVALQRAARTVREFQDASGRHIYAHPYYWASFVLVGDDR